MSAGPRRSGSEKVAIILLALGNSLGPKVLQKFRSAEIKHIMESATELGRIDRDDLDVLVDDFAANFAKSLGLGMGVDDVRSLVEQAFSPGELDRMLGASVAPAAEPVWSKFGAGSENALVPYLLDEHPQTIAYILSNLDAELSARCLAMLPGDLRNSAAKRLLKLNRVADNVTRLAEACLERDLLAQSDSGLEDEGRRKLASLLNKLDRSQASSIFDSLAATRPEDAKRLRGMVFSFEDIQRLAQPALLALFDKLQTEQVIAALRGAPASLKEVALSSLGARARRMVESELANDQGQVSKEGETARRAIADLVLAMAGRGELALPEADAAA